MSSQNWFTRSLGSLCDISTTRYCLTSSDAPEQGYQSKPCSISARPGHQNLRVYICVLRHRRSLQPPAVQCLSKDRPT